MEIFPAIDLRGGQVVRLYQGDYDKETVYGQDPCAAARSFLEAGAKCYTYDNGFLHAKGMTVDGIVSCYGTANMDIRSFKLNFEVNAVIYSVKTTEELDRRFLEDLKNCTQITPYLYGQRSYLVRVKEQFSRLFSPLL